MENAIQDIRRRLRDGRYTSEAQVSQGIVQRIIRELGWDTSDTDLVYPEYPLEGLRVDFALCYPPREPLIFIEIKQVGRSDGADQQLFEYAYKKGIPVGILTDGQVWSFYLPGGQGDFSARLVYKLDLLEREIEEVVQRFRRYLDYGQVRKGAARRAINDDYDDVHRDRIARRALPEAWNKLLEEKDDSLVEIVADKVQAMIDSRPDSEAVLSFLLGLHMNNLESHRTVNRVTSQPKVSKQPRIESLPPLSQSISQTTIGFVFDNAEYKARSDSDILVQLFNLFSKETPSFLENFYKLDVPTNRKPRRRLGKTKEELNPDPDPSKSTAHMLESGWVIDTKIDTNQKKKMAELALEAANIDASRLQIKWKQS